MSLQSGKGTYFCHSCLWPMKDIRSERCGSCATKLKIKRHYENPEEREKFGTRMRKYWSRPNIRKEMAERVKKQWMNPKYLEKQRVAHKEYFKNPEAIEKNRQIQKHCLARMVAINDPEYRRKLSLAQSKYWADPNGRKERIVSIKRGFAKPGSYEKRSGLNSHAWRGGCSLEPYGRGFTRTLKQAIKQRDQYLCQNPSCYIPENGKPHHVHHVDYIKKNNNPVNLLTLCFAHHEKTISGNREYWAEYYQNIQALRGLNP